MAIKSRSIDHIVVDHDDMTYTKIYSDNGHYIVDAKTGKLYTKKYLYETDSDTGFYESSIFMPEYKLPENYDDPITEDDMKTVVESNEKFLSVEIPTCEYTTYKKFFEISVHNLVKLAPYIQFVINYQRPEFTDELVYKAVRYLRSLGFTVYFKISEYTADEKKSIQYVRERTHAIHPSAPFIMSTDDDISYDKGYDKLLLATIVYLSNIPAMGYTFFQPHSEGITDNGIIYAHFPNIVPSTANGLIVRNIYGWNGLVPSELQKLVGPQSDALIPMERIRAGFYGSHGYTNLADHIFNRTTPGFSQHKWVESLNQPDSINSYMTRVYKKYDNVHIPKEIVEQMTRNIEYTKVPSFLFRYEDFSFEEIEEMLAVYTVDDVIEISNRIEAVLKGVDKSNAKVVEK